MITLSHTTIKYILYGVLKAASNDRQSVDIGRVEEGNRGIILALYCQKIEENQIPHSLVINLDQTPSKFVPGCNKTLAEKGSKTVSIAGSTDKRTITATFAITLSGNFLPIQLIYGGKTSKSIPAVAFPPEFVLSANEKHYSNEKESLNMLEKIIVPFVEKERRSLDLDSCHPALLIMDVFKGQMTDLVQEVFEREQLFSREGPC